MVRPITKISSFSLKLETGTMRPCSSLGVHMSHCGLPPHWKVWLLLPSLMHGRLVKAWWVVFQVHSTDFDAYSP